jgi:hypothetical protein
MRGDSTSMFFEASGVTLSFSADEFSGIGMVGYGVIVAEIKYLFLSEEYSLNAKSIKTPTRITAKSAVIFLSKLRQY